MTSLSNGIPGGRSRVGTDHNTAVELHGHNRRLERDNEEVEEEFGNKEVIISDLNDGKPTKWSLTPVDTSSRNQFGTKASK